MRAPATLGKGSEMIIQEALAKQLGGSATFKTCILQ